jgi:putative sigma-54 modulation protein
MKIDITARHIELTPALKSFTEEKLAKLEKLLDDTTLDAHVVLFVEKHRHVAEIQVKSRTAVFSGQEETDDLYSSIREVADKLERQALKHKEKITDHHKQKRGPKFGEAAAELDAQALEAQQPASPVPTGPRIVRRQSYRVKPMSPEDALLDLESTRDPLIVFRDSATDRMSVLYRLDNGDFALIAPDY